MDYKHRRQKDNYYIVDTIKKAIKALNDKKGTKFRLLNATFGIGVDSEYGIAGQLDKTITASIEDTSNKKYMKLFWYESFFEAELPDDKDEDSGASKMSDPEDKVLLRVAYSIWSNRRWMSKPQTKKRKII